VCVNELQREARQKLFSYAVAALSNYQVLKAMASLSLRLT
jgi:hypothetical protein